MNMFKKNAPQLDTFSSPSGGVLEKWRRNLRRPDWALVLGGGADMWLEVEILEGLIGGFWPGIVIAANNAGVDWPRYLDHWVTLHPEKLHGVDPDDGSGDWLRSRSERQGGILSREYETWGRRSPELVDHVIQPWGGMASGGFGCRVAHELTTEQRKVVLCGVPMSETPHYHDDHNGENWRHADLHWRSWVRQMFRVEGWVRSMSGRTRETLGYPTLEWLKS